MPKVHLTLREPGELKNTHLSWPHGRISKEGYPTDVAYEGGFVIISLSSGVEKAFPAERVVLVDYRPKEPHDEVE